MRQVSGVSRGHGGLASGFALAGAALLLGSVPAWSHQDDAERPSVDEVMIALGEKYGDNDKKYDSLAKKISKEVQKALKAGTWTSGDGDGAERSLEEHPFLVMVQGLSDEAEGLQKAGNSDAAKEALEEFPWQEDLELVLGLEYGSDRAVPDHENGFIDLETCPEPVQGFPELLTNQYLYGLGQIVSWQYRVASKKSLAFEGRGPKDKPEMEETLPGWESIRVHLLGSLPEVPLFAIPQLTHRIHSRLAERRAEAGEPDPMDRYLTLLDATWNGFHFELPYAKKRIAVVQPAYALFSTQNAFFHQFPPADRLEESGDIPFVAVTTHQLYANTILGQDLGPGDFISESGPGRDAADRFQAESVYVSRYRSLIDEIVRAALAPGLPYPSYLAYLDYPGKTPPADRTATRDYDVARTHALMVWAHAGKDPAAVADFLHDELLSTDPHRFPSQESLPVALTLLVREREAAMMAAIAERAAGDRDFEREFSPHAEYLGGSGDPACEFMLESYHGFHRQVSEVIRDAAYGVVMKEIGG